MGLCLLAKLLNGALLKKMNHHTAVFFFDGTLMVLFVLAMLCCLMASTAVFNGALCASHVINGALSVGQAFKWGFVEKNESSHSCGFFDGTLMVLFVLAMLCCLMASTAVFNGALCASPRFVADGRRMAR